jgi:hypothetical protein
MATTTPNFGWPVPTSTDLVKDGAVAIETLGDSIDASLVDLKGGTTGQVLAKASNTDMDFTWSTDASGISPTIFAAKGDLLGASANDTPAVLTVGANGETLVADSSTSTGLRYSGGNAVGNPVINSAFQIWQRGTTGVAATATGAYYADRWTVGRGAAGSTASRQLTSDTTNLPSIQYCARIQRDSGNTSTSGIFTATSFETVNSIPYLGKTVTISYYARAGANYSSASNALSATGVSGTGTDQQVLQNYTGSVAFASGTATLTTTWQRFTATGTVSATANEIAIYFNYTPVGTAGANDYFEVTGVQLDLGSVALPFRTYAATIQGELSAAQRYYWRAGLDSSGTFGILGNSGYTDSTTNSNVMFNFPVHMRVAPTAIDFPTLSTTRILNVGNPFTPTAASLNTTNTTADIGWVAFTSSGMTASQFSQYTRNSSSTSYIGFSAEL